VRVIDEGHGLTTFQVVGTAVLTQTLWRMTLILIIYKKLIPVSDRRKSAFLKAIESLRCLRTHSLFTVEQYAPRTHNTYINVTYGGIHSHTSTGLQPVYICLYVRQCVGSDSCKTLLLNVINITY
jgi:hypothetical protein